MLRLEAVTVRNVWNLLKLSVREDQKRFVADNERSIVEAYVTEKANGHAMPFGIYEDDTPVGFLMIGYGVDDEWDDAPDFARDNYALWRLMIDEKYQGKGYGRQAIRLALNYIKTWPCGKADHVWVDYCLDNSIARHLYNSFGFVEGEPDDSEYIAILPLK